MCTVRVYACLRVRVFAYACLRTRVCVRVFAYACLRIDICEFNTKDGLIRYPVPICRSAGN